MADKEYSHLKKPFFIAVIITALYLLLSSTNTPFFATAKLKTQDFFYRINYKIKKHHPSVKEVVLVTIDENAYYRYGKRWPWKRDILAAMLYNISKGHPKVIGMNLAFFNWSGEEDDVILREAFKDVGNVVVASYFMDDNKYITPNKYFSGVIKDYGFTNKPIEIDEVIRYTKLFEPLDSDSSSELMINKNILDYSLEIKLLCSYLDTPSDEIVFEKGKLKIIKNGNTVASIPCNSYGNTFLNYTVKAKDLETVSVQDVLSNNFAPGAFKDKIVIIGTVGKIFKELNNTPLQSLSGVEILANSIIMILSQNYIITAPSIINFIIFAIFITSGIYCFWRFKAIKNIIIVTCFLLLFFGLSILLLINNVIIDFFSIPVFLFFSYFAVEAVKYSSLLFDEIKLKHMVITDDITGLFTRRYFIFKLGNDLRKSVGDKRNLSVILLTIDNYDFLTNSLGPEKSYLLLKDIGHLIKKNSRVTRGEDFIARYGEHLFSVILKDSSDKGACLYINRLKNKLEKPRKLQTGDEYKVSLTVGVVALNLISTEKPDLFIECAHKALKRAEVEGPGKVVIYNKNLDKIDIDQYDIPKVSSVDFSFVSEELNEKNKELRTRIAKLRTAYQEIAAAEKFSAMGKLTSSIHHELNNPLRSLRTCLQTIIKDLEGPPDLQSASNTNNLLNASLDEVNRMIEMNKGLKQLYRPAKISLEHVDLNKLLHEMLDLLKVELNRHRITVISDLEPDVPIIDANKSALRQSFLNIIINAIDAMPNSGTLTIKTGFNKQNKKVQIKISDSGSGISQENLKKIFDALFTTKGDEQGAGLGLYVTKQKIELYKGTIEVDSKINKGTTFTITFLAENQSKQ